MFHAKEIGTKAEEANLLDDILYSVYRIRKDDMYDAIIAPSWGLNDYLGKM